MRAAASLIPRGRFALLVVVPLAAAILVGVGSAGAAGAPTSIVFTVTGTDCSGHSATVTSDSTSGTVTPSAGVCFAPGSLTLTATVTSSAGAPTGAIVFGDSPDASNWDGPDPALLLPASGTSSSATWDTSFNTPTNLLWLRAVYQPVDTSFQLVKAPLISISIGNIPIHNTTTTVTINGNATGTITTTVGDPVTITATIAPASSSDTTVPTGTVHFYSDTGNHLGDAPLVGGTASLPADPTFAVGTHSISAQYAGDTFYLGSSGGFTLVVNPGGVQTIATTTAVTLSPTVIHTGDLVTVTARVAQNGASVHPLGGLVKFRADGQVIGTSIALIFDNPPGTSSGVAVLTDVGAWNPGPHTISVEYQGDTFNAPSSAQISFLVVGDQSAAATFTGPATATVGVPTTLSAKLTGALGAPLAGEQVTLATADGESCTGTTTLLGAVSCGPFTFTHAGPLPVTVSFAGDATYGPASAVGALTVQPATSSLVYTGATAAATNQPITLAATLTANGAPLVGRHVVLTLNNNEQCAADTDANGKASCTVTVGEPPSAAPYGVTAIFAGDGDDTPASASGQVTVSAVQATSLTYTGDTTAFAHGAATLSFLLIDPNGHAVAGKTVTIVIAGATYTAMTGSNGVATVTVTAPGSGTYGVAGSFAGDSVYASSTGRGSLRVNPVPTALAVGGDAGVVSGHAATLTATLTNASTHTPLAAKSVRLTVNGNAQESCTALTSAAGVVSCSIVANEAARTTPYVVTGTFTSTDPDYLSSVGTGSLTVMGTPTTTGYLAPIVGVFGSKVYLSGYLLGGGAPLSGKTLTLSLPGNGGSCTATTGFLGIAVCSTPVTLPKTPGATLAITVSFSGDDADQPSTGTGYLYIAKAATTLTLDSVNVVQQGGSVTLGATLTRAADGAKLADKIVTLTFGAQSCTDATDVNGHATCTVTRVTAPYGTKTSVTASFGGDDAYLASNAHSGSNPCVFGLAGRGLFVIGDKTSLSSTVTFWGSQWSKQNSLSFGSPSSFKGFADTDTSTCNVTWTTRTGNSTPPADGPLPPYMAVAVSSKISQNGSVISGDVKKIVIVATNSGYDSNPGHAGTGAVVATLCGG